MQDDLETVDFGARWHVSLFDMKTHCGDSSMDADTCKMHTQLCTAWNRKFIGNAMQTNCSTGEQLLKTKAKFVSKTAQKQGVNHFTYQTSKRVGEFMLLERAKDIAASQERHHVPNNKPSTLLISVSTAMTLTM